MSDRVSRILIEISRLTLDELAELRRRFNEEPPPAGVREPVTPRPPTRPPRQA